MRVNPAVTPALSSWKALVKEERRGDLRPSLPASSSAGLEALEAWLTWLWSDALDHWRWCWLGLRDIDIADGEESAEPRWRDA
jgi:hypothetical protein